MDIRSVYLGILIGRTVDTCQMKTEQNVTDVFETEGTEQKFRAALCNIYLNCISMDLLNKFNSASHFIPYSYFKRNRITKAALL